MKRLALLLGLLAFPASAGWYVGTTGSGAGVCSNCVVFGVANSYSNATAGGAASVDVSVSSIPAGAILVLFGTTDGATTAASTVSGAGLSWTRRLSNSSVDIWTAYNAGGPTSGTVTFTPGPTTFAVLASVMVVTGADPTYLTNVTYMGTFGPLSAWSVGVELGANQGLGIGVGYTYTGGGYTMSAGANTAVDVTLNNPNGGVQVVTHNTAIPSTGTTTMAGTWSGSVSGYSYTVGLRKL